MNTANIFDNIFIDKKNEQVFDILKKDNIRIEKIVSNGQKSEKDFWYEQEENEFIMVIDGDAIIEFEDKECELKKGDYLIIEKMIKHRVKYTDTNGPTIWLAVFY